MKKFEGMRRMRCVLPAMMLLMSCKKIIITEPKEDTKKISYLTVSCNDCRIDYGMPDQYKGFTQTGISAVKYDYTYVEGYTLRVDLLALNTQQEIKIEVYDTEGKVIYNSKKVQPTEGIWSLSIKLPTELH